MARFYQRGIHLEQHKEPAISSPLYCLDGITFPAFTYSEFSQFDTTTIYKIIEYSKIRDEHSGKLLFDLVNEALRMPQLEMLVLNAVDDDPFTSSSIQPFLQLMPYAILGLRMLEHVLHPQKICCAVSKKIDVDGSNLKIPDWAADDIKIRKISGKYPQSPRLAERFGTNALAVGSCALINLGRSLVIGEFSRVCFVTAAGDGIERPMNFAVLPGTPIQEIIAVCGLNGEPQKIILGSVMSGRAVEGLQAGVEITTKSIIAMSRFQIRTNLSCIGCGRCISVCPQRLSPYYLYKNSRGGVQNKQLTEMAQRCIECGSCAYVCLAKCNPTHYIKLYKRRILSEQAVEREEERRFADEENFIQS